MSNNQSLNETGQSFNQKIVYLDNPGQNIWNEVKKSNKIV